jgi:hypothetical protein
MNLKTAIAVKQLVCWLIDSPLPDLYGFRPVTAEEARDAAAHLSVVANHPSNSHGQFVPDEKTVRANFPMHLKKKPRARK